MIKSDGGREVIDVVALVQQFLNRKLMNTVDERKMYDCKTGRRGIRT